MFNFGSGKTAKRKATKKRANRARNVEKWVRDNFDKIADEEDLEEKVRPSLDVISVTEIKCMQEVRQPESIHPACPFYHDSGPRTHIERSYATESFFFSGLSSFGSGDCDII